MKCFATVSLEWRSWRYVLIVADIHRKNYFLINGAFFRSVIAALLLPSGQQTKSLRTSHSGRRRHNPRLWLHKNGTLTTTSNIYYLLLVYGHELEFAPLHLQFATYGFGARIPPQGQVSHNFFVTLTESPYCFGIHGVLEAYRSAFSCEIIWSLLRVW